MKDTGQGIAKADMPLLFTRFGKLERTNSINKEGIGLGLNIVKQIVNSINGEVSVYSDGVGQGSTFSVTLMIEPVIVQSLDYSIYSSNSSFAQSIADLSISDAINSEESQQQKLL